MKISMKIIMGLCWLFVCLGYSFQAGAEEKLVYILGTPGVYSTEGPDMLFDDDVLTKWCVKMEKGKSTFVIFKTQKAVSINGYLMAKANDDALQHGRSPQKWRLFGSNSSSASKENDKSWEMIDSYQDPSTPILNDNENYHSYAIMLKKSVPAYQYYKLVVDSTYGGGILQLSEFQLITNNTINAKFVVTKNEKDAVMALTRIKRPDTIMILPTSYCSENGTFLIGRALVPIQTADYVPVMITLKQGAKWPQKEVLEAELQASYDVNEKTVNGLSFSKITIISK